MTIIGHLVPILTINAAKMVVTRSFVMPFDDGLTQVEWKGGLLATKNVYIQHALLREW